MNTDGDVKPIFDDRRRLKPLRRLIQISLAQVVVSLVLCLVERSVIAINESPCTPPSISSQPQNQLVCPGQTVTNSVTASGDSLTYQWRKNGLYLNDGGSISGSASPTLILSNVTGTGFSAVNSCVTILGSFPGGMTVGFVSSNSTYTCTASGCIENNQDGIVYFNPDGNTSTDDCVTVDGGPTNIDSASRCSSLVPDSLVGKVGAACSQLGTSGSFTPGASGRILLFVNDSNYAPKSGSWNVCIGSSSGTNIANYDVIIVGACGSVTSSVATVALSTPCDGIPDWWRLQYFGFTNIDTNTCAACDPASDCLSNLEKYQDNLSPTNHLPVATVTGGGSICNGGSISVQASLSGSGPWILTWSDGVIMTNGSSPAIRSISPTTTTNFAVTSVSNGGCSGGTATGNAAVTVNATPICSITGPSSLCASSTNLVYSGPSGAGFGYSWSISGIGTIVGASNTQSVTVAPADEAGSFTLSVSVFTASCGTSSCSQAVTINSSPMVSITAPASVCAGSTGNTASGPPAFSVLHQFQGTDGSFPNAALTQGSDGNFYGTASQGGMSGVGTVFRITPAGTLTTLYEFSGTDGYNPMGALIQGSDGYFYGTTYQGGTNGQGSLFRITSAGTLTTLYQFSGTDGSAPVSSLVQGSDGNFYGVTLRGGTNNEGVVFQLTTAGTLTVLHQFGGVPDGMTPYGPLIQANDGNFYGMTFAGGTSSSAPGTVFKISSAGTFTTLHKFNSSEGFSAESGLIQGSDGNFYGATSFGGGGEGNVFKMTSAGAITPLHNFVGGNDGWRPFVTLVQEADSNFYGTTSQRGALGGGTIFKISSAGTLTTIFAFGGGTNGSGSGASLLMGNDGYFYGTTFGGGTNSEGSVFRFSPNAYAWAISNATITAGGTGSTVTWTAGTNTPAILTLTMTGLDGCGSSTNQPVTVNAHPICLISGLNLVCANITNSYVGPSGSGLSYNWTISGNGTITGTSNAQSVDVCGISAGSYTLDLAVTASGCNSNCSMIATVNPPTTCSITGAGTVCAGTVGNVYTAPLGAGFTYAWTISGNGTIVGASNTANISVDAAASGSFTLGLTVGGSNCTSGSCSQTVAINTVIPSSPVVGSNGPLCAGGTLTLSASTVAGATYQWSGPNGYTSSNQNPSIPNITTNGSGYYCVIAMVNSCVSTQDCVLVTVNLPTAQVVGTTNIFIGGSATIEAELTGTPNWIVNWSDGIITTNASSLSVRVVDPAVASTYSVLNVSDANCSTGAVSGSATVTPLLILGPPAVCALSISNTYMALPGMDSYLWTISGDGTISGETTQQTVSVFAGPSNDFSLAVSMSITSSYLSATNIVSIEQLPLVNIQATPLVCASSVSNVAWVPAVTTLYQFSGSTDGSRPLGAMVQGTDGNFYGSTSIGGTDSAGTIFKITPSGTLTLLHTFTGGSDGESPEGPLIMGNDGSFYGTTLDGGSSTYGSLFKITTAGTLTTLHSFSFFGSDGGNPNAGITQLTNGDIYGTCEGGGSSGGGTIFRLTSGGTFTVLHSFTGGGEGSGPQGAPVQGIDGSLYGSTSSGGTGTWGTFYKITTAGTLTTLYSFSRGADGGIPLGKLIQDSSGNFYGVTQTGGTNDMGTVFRITPTGTLTTLYRFSGGDDGENPMASLVAVSNANFYGTTTAAGMNGAGTVFMITSAGTFTTLYGFSGGFDGSSPRAELVQGNDGNLYGTTYAGGTNGAGTVFLLNPEPSAYYWSVSGGTITSGQGTWGIRWIAGGGSNATLCIDVTNAVGCLASSCTNVVLHPLPPATITAPSSVVVYSTNNTASVTDAGLGSTYMWNIVNGVIYGGQGTTNITWGAGTEPVTLGIIVSSPAFSCVSTSSLSVGVATPVATPSNSGPICQGQTLNLTASSVDNATYNWTGPNGFFSVLQNPTITDSLTVDAGLYCVVAIIDGISSSQACTTVTINSQPTIAVAGAICSGSTNVASVSDTSNGGTYTWSIDGGTITLGQGTTNIIWVAGMTNSVDLSVVLAFGTGCSSTDSVEVAVDSLVAITISVPPFVCVGSTDVLASVSTAGSGASYTWSVANGTLVSGQGSPNIVWSATTIGTATVSVAITTSSGCVESNAVAAIVGSLPACLITGPSVVSSNSAGNVYSTGTQSGLNYLWTISGNGTIDGDPTAPSINVDVGDSGTFTVSLSLQGAAGCESSCSSSVSIGSAAAPDIGWWKFNEGSGTNAFDSTTNADTGYLQGTSLPVWTGGISSNALLFDGSENEVEIPDSTVLSPSNAVTVTAWVMASTATNGVIASKWATNGLDGSYQLSLSQGKVIFQLFTAGTAISVTGATAIADSDWHHVAGIYDGAQVRVYLDGNIDGAASSSGAIDTVSAPLLIGHATSGLGFPGRITDVRIYSRVLAGSEVSAIFNIDSDADGLPDWWMQLYFGHPTGLASDNTRATDFYNGNNIDNLTAYLEGDDPTKGPAITDTGGTVSLQVFTPLE